MSRCIPTSIVVGALALTLAPGTLFAQGDARPGVDAGNEEVERVALERVPDDSFSRLTVSTGAEYSSGDFGDDQDTDILYVPLSLKYETDHWFARITVPYIRIEGPGDVVGGTQGTVITGEPQGGRETDRESGIGDIVTSLTYVVNPRSEGVPIVELTGKVKVPTADEDENLGTGETDYTAQVDLIQSFGRFTPFATLGYRFLGDSSEFDLDDTAFGSVGFSYRATDRTQLGVAFDFRQASTSGTDDPQEAVLFGSVKLSKRLKLSPYVVLGLSDGSPDYASGFSVSLSY